MFKAIKDEKIIAINETGDFPCLIYDEVVEDTEHTCEDYEQYNGEYLLKSEIPAPTKEEIKAERERLYVLYSDKLKNDYDEDVARYGLESSEALESKKIWLDKKDEIRENNPYNDTDEEI